MKKIIIIAAILAAALSLNAQSPYLLGEDGYYHYTGDAVQRVAVDFSMLTPADVAYTTGTTHADRVMDFQGVGMYKFCYLASRKCGTGVDDPVYGPLAWNNGSSENGRNYDIKDSQPEKLPAVYFPEVEGGIKYVITEGWCYNQSRTLIFQAENASGAWVDIKQVAPDMQTSYQTMRKNAYTRDTLVVNSAAVKKIRFYRNSNEYLFLNNVEVISMADNGDPIEVESVTLDKAEAQMEVSQTLNLVCTVRPFNATNKVVAWSSSDETKATVDDAGVVTAVAAGEADITASCGNYSAVCHLTIAGETPVSSVTLDEHSLRVAEGKYARLNVTVLPLDASNPTVTWSSSDQTIATVVNGLVHAIKEGFVDIIATAGAMSDTCKVEIYWEMPEASDYVIEEYYPGCQYYVWYGENQTKPIVIDFTKWKYEDLSDPLWPDFQTTRSNGHSDALVQRENIGFYQWMIYEGRSLGNTGYVGEDGSTSANVLFNCGYTYLDGVKEGAGSVVQCKRPRIYFPSFKAGVHQVRITGVSYQNTRSMFVSYRNMTTSTLGTDSVVMQSLPYLNFGNTWDEYVVDINAEEISDVNISRNSTDFWFIGKIEVIPYETSALERVQDNRYEARGVQGGILINSKCDLTVEIYSLTGALLHEVEVREGIHTVIPVSQGCYIVNNDKVIVR